MCPPVDQRCTNWVSTGGSRFNKAQLISLHGRSLPIKQLKIIKDCENWRGGICRASIGGCCDVSCRSNRQEMKSTNLSHVFLLSYMGERATGKALFQGGLCLCGNLIKLQYCVFTTGTICIRSYVKTSNFLMETGSSLSPYSFPYKESRFTMSTVNSEQRKVSKATLVVEQLPINLDIRPSSLTASLESSTSLHFMTLCLVQRGGNIYYFLLGQLQGPQP